MVCVPWGGISYAGFKEVSIINTQLPCFSFHNVCQYTQGQVQLLQRLCLQLKDGLNSFPTIMWTGLNNFSPLGEASRHHVGYEVHTLPTVFMEVKDSWPLSSLTKSLNILSNEFIARGQALTVKYHIVHPFVIRGLTRTTAAEFCCPPKSCPKQTLVEFPVGGTVEQH